jgi:hypothetical protein
MAGAQSLSEDGCDGIARGISCSCVLLPHGTISPAFSPTPCGASGGVRSRKPVVGRGPRDQTGRQKPRARAPEALPRPAALRFKRASRREVGRGRFAGLLLNFGLKLFLGGFWVTADDFKKSRPDATFF